MRMTTYRETLMLALLALLAVTACGREAIKMPLDLVEQPAADLGLRDLARTDQPTLPSFDFGGLDAAIDCPSSPPLTRAPCKVGLRCEYADPCGASCYCDDVFLRGGQEPGEWRCSYEAGSSCGASLCPSHPPLPQDGEGGGLVACDHAAWESSTCHYLDAPAGCSTTCSCTLENGWWCNLDCACPSSPPSESDACEDVYHFKTCSYADRQCFCRREIDPGPFTWDCHAQACPTSAPGDGAPCDLAADVNVCAYATAPYCGNCRCLPTGTWSCSASSCDDCPPTPPATLSSCEGLANESCQWLVPAEVGLGHTTYCTCSSTEQWLCHDV